MISLISESYHGADVSVRVIDGYVNATEMAKAAACGKKPRAPFQFLKAEATRRFQHALVDELSKTANAVLPIVKLVEVHHGGIAPGTWMHPDLALEFARWLSPEFAIWTNRVVRKVLAGGTAPAPAVDLPARLIDALSALADSHVKLDARVSALEDFATAPESRVSQAMTHHSGGRSRTWKLADFLPALRRAAPSEGGRLGYSELRRAAAAEIPDSSFARLLSDAVRHGLAVKCADGRYFVPGAMEVQS